MIKIKALLIACFFGLMTSAFAANQHLHPQATQNEPQQATDKKVSWPGYCEIEIANYSFSDVIVSGFFDDGAPLLPFYVYSFESPHYISLFYYGYCHDGMTLFIDAASGYRVYAGYTEANSTIRIYPSLNQVKASKEAKK